jgi:hypothetical protein
VGRHRPSVRFIPMDSGASRLDLPTIHQVKLRYWSVDAVEPGTDGPGATELGINSLEAHHIFGAYCQWFHP